MATASRIRRTNALDDPGAVDTNGCPDSDGDKLADSVDQCAECCRAIPPTTAARSRPRRPARRRRRWMNDVVDRCPFASGLAGNRGCPPASATPRLYANAIDDLFVMREAGTGRVRARKYRLDGGRHAVRLRGHGRHGDPPPPPQQNEPSLARRVGHFRAVARDLYAVPVSRRIQLGQRRTHPGHLHPGHRPRHRLSFISAAGTRFHPTAPESPISPSAPIYFPPCAAR